MDNWFEVWADYTGEIPYLLILSLKKDVYQIIDPQEKGKVIFNCKEYVKASYFLTEDEYELVNGRIDTN